MNNVIPFYAPQYLYAVTLELIYTVDCKVSNLHNNTKQHLIILNKILVIIECFSLLEVIMLMIARINDNMQYKIRVISLTFHLNREKS